MIQVRPAKVRGTSGATHQRLFVLRLRVCGGIAALALVSVMGCGGGTDQPSSKVSLVHGGSLEAWSPNSRSLAVSGDEGSNSEESPVSGDNRVKLVSPDSSDRRDIPVPRTDPVGELAWASDGRLHYLTRPPSGQRGVFATSVRPNGQDLGQVPLGAPVSGAGWAPQGWPLAFVPNSNTFAIVGGRPGPPYSIKGEHTVRVGPSPNLSILDGPDSNPHQMLSIDGEEQAPVFSPDGRTILFTVHAKRDDIWTVKRDGTGQRVLVAGLVSASATWSPDSKRIAMSAVSESGDRRYHLYVVSADRGRLRQVSDEEVLTDSPAWTPDGQWLTYATYDGEIKRIHPDGTGAEVIASFPGHEIRDLLWSPDGQHLAYTSRPFHHET
jgi:hypothetical protein